MHGDDGNGGATPGDAKKTIQAGINAVSTGGTVEVAAATYDEDPFVNKSLSLRGAQADQTVDLRTFGASRRRRSSVR